MNIIAQLIQQFVVFAWKKDILGKKSMRDSIEPNSQLTLGCFNPSFKSVLAVGGDLFFRRYVRPPDAGREMLRVSRKLQETMTKQT
jgi:hypothetical protein